MNRDRDRQDDEEKGDFNNTFVHLFRQRIVETILDPGVILIYYDQAALSTQNSPVQQRPTVAQLAEAFKNYVYQRILGSTPESNCVESTQGPGV